MPFTFSHPAAVIPLAKKGLILSAVIIGSMAPDFEYFLRLSTKSHFGHTFPGIFLLSLPAGLLIFWLFQSFIKKPAIALLPSGFQSRLALNSGRILFSGTGSFIMIVISILIGIVTHITWDSFTHADGYIVQLFPILRKSVSILNHSFPVYNLLQHASTLTGALLIIYYTMKWYKNEPERKVISFSNLSDKSKIIIISVILLSATVSGILYSSLSFSLLDNFNYIRQVTGNTVVYIITFTFIGFIIYSAIWHLRFAEDKNEME